MAIRDLLPRAAGRDPHPASHGEKLLSALGAFLGILGVLAISHTVLDGPGAAMVATSMGASAVLLFAAPHSPLAQPWPVLGGHLISAAIGVSCAQQLADPMAAAALAVALAVGAMYYLGCLHPPGGASALTAVVGGEAVRGLGYAYLLTPLLVNVAILLTVAVLFNRPFRHRRYPLPGNAPARAAEEAMIAHSDLVYALSEMDSFIDVSEADLLRIYRLATCRASAPERLPTHR